MALDTANSFVHRCLVRLTDHKEGSKNPYRVLSNDPSYTKITYSFVVCTHNHRRQKCEGSSPNSFLRPISYFGSVWELYVLDLKTKVFCRKEKEPATFSHGQGTHSTKIVLIVWPEIAQMPNKFSAQFVCPSPKILNF